MALGDPYATPADLTARTGQADDGTFTSRLAAASRDVEAFTGRQFNQAASVSDRVFFPLGSDLAVVDDFFTTTGLVIVTDDDGDGVFESTWTATDYQLEPLNGIRGGMPGWPFWMIRAAGWSRRFFGTRRANVRVTAQWGWAAVPAGIKEATLAVAEASEFDSPGDVRSMAIDGYSTTFVARKEGEVPSQFLPAVPYQLHDGFA